MNNKIAIFIMSMAFLAISCATTASTTNYIVNLPLSEDEDGLQAYLLDFDSGNKLDSAIVENGKAVFTGLIDAPAMVQLVIDGSRAGTFILEPGTINADVQKRTFTGTPLNERLEQFGQQQQDIVKRFRELPQDSTLKQKQKDLENDFNSLNEKTMKENINNPIGLYLFLQKAYEFNRNALDKAIAEYPHFASSKRVAKLRTSLINKEETSVGRRFKDFEITYDGKIDKLSNYVGKGKYTLVDFWASWCGPCIRETKVIKELYNKYSDKGLEVLGVAVWDEPANTLKAIETHQLPWKQIINAQTIPTEIYGISGIPCIILFDPEGNIVSRDKQDDELVADVDEAMAKLLKE